MNTKVPCGLKGSVVTGSITVDEMFYESYSTSV